jgi:hypothetical protein
MTWKYDTRCWECDAVVECLLSMQEALNLFPSTPSQKKKYDIDHHSVI